MEELDTTLARREPLVAERRRQGTDGDGNDAGLDPVLAGDADKVISKEAILRRIEEDRERHKRLRESLWVIPRDDSDHEFNQAWEETSDLCSDDFEVMREEMALHKQSLST